MPKKTQYALVDPFEIDNGELNGAPAELAFALGVEWAMFRRQVDESTSPFTILCLSQNAGRFVRMAERKGRFVEERRTDPAGWTQLWVGDFIACAPAGPRSR